MGSLRTSGCSAGSQPKQVISKTLASVVSVLAWSAATAAPAQPSLCGGAETTLFSCPVGQKIVSVCSAGGKATYRYGTLGKVELSSQALSFAETAFSGGGETQISFRNGAYSYIVYDKTTRTSFSSDGHNDPDFTSGLVVQENGKTVLAEECGADATISADAGHVIHAGAFVAH